METTVVCKGTEISVPWLLVLVVAIRLSWRVVDDADPVQLQQRLTLVS